MSSSAVQDFNAEQIGALVGKLGGRDQVLRVLSGEAAIQVVSPAPTLRIVAMSGELGFEERVGRGDYGWRHTALTQELFPAAEPRQGEWEQKLFHFNRGLSSQQAIADIGEAGYAPGRIDDILAFGDMFPQEQRRYPVIGLGSVAEVDTSLSVPALWFDGDRRTLDLIWYDGDWHRNYRFLGVRPLQVQG